MFTNHFYLFIIIVEAIPPSTQTFNDYIKDVEDNHPSLLLVTTKDYYLFYLLFLLSRFLFNDLFDNFDYETIRNKILRRQMITCPFTTVLWRIFLHCLQRDSSQWNQMIDTAREHYDELADKYLLDLKKIREHNGDSKDLNHPLSQEEDVIKIKYYQ